MKFLLINRYHPHFTMLPDTDALLNFVGDLYTIPDDEEEYDENDPNPSPIDDNSKNYQAAVVGWADHAIAGDVLELRDDHWIVVQNDESGVTTVKVKKLTKTVTELTTVETREARKKRLEAAAAAGEDAEDEEMYEDDEAPPRKKKRIDPKTKKRY